MERVAHRRSVAASAPRFATCADARNAPERNFRGRAHQPKRNFRPMRQSTEAQFSTDHILIEIGSTDDSRRPER